MQAPRHGRGAGTAAGGITRKRCALAGRGVDVHNGVMAANRYAWLIRLLALLMALNTPLQALAATVASPTGSCPGMHTLVPAQGADDDAMQLSAHSTAHCTHMTQAGGEQPLKVYGSKAHNCDSSCTGSCGLCAHCPVGIGSFSAFTVKPVRHFAALIQQQPSDVTPDAVLRPPRRSS